MESLLHGAAIGRRTNTESSKINESLEVLPSFTRPAIEDPCSAVVNVGLSPKTAPRWHERTAAIVHLKKYRGFRSLIRKYKLLGKVLF